MLIKTEHKGQITLDIETPSNSSSFSYSLLELPTPSVARMHTNPPLFLLPDASTVPSTVLRWLELLNFLQSSPPQSYPTVLVCHSARSTISFSLIKAFQHLHLRIIFLCRVLASLWCPYFRATCCSSNTQSNVWSLTGLHSWSKSPQHHNYTGDTFIS